MYQVSRTLEKKQGSNVIHSDELPELYESFPASHAAIFPREVVRTCVGAPPIS